MLLPKQTNTHRCNAENHPYCSQPTARHCKKLVNAGFKFWKARRPSSRGPKSLARLEERAALDPSSPKTIMAGLLLLLLLTRQEERRRRGAGVGACSRLLFFYEFFHYFTSLLIVNIRHITSHHSSTTDNSLII